MKQITGAVMLALALLPLGAEAHAHLVQSTPADGSELTPAPASFTLQFNEPARLTALNIKKERRAAHRLGPPAGAPSARWVVAVAGLSLPAGYAVKPPRAQRRQPHRVRQYSVPGA